MVKKPRYIVDQAADNGDVFRSDAFKTQREVVAAFPAAFTDSTVRAPLRKNPRIHKGSKAKLEKYKKHWIRRYDIK